MVRVSRRDVLRVGATALAGGLVGMTTGGDGFPGPRIERAEGDSASRRDRNPNADVENGQYTFVESQRGGEPVSTRSVSVDWWARNEAVRAAKYDVAETIADGLTDPDVDTDDIYSGETGNIETRTRRNDAESGLADVLVEYVYNVYGDEVRAKPAMSFDRVVELAPQSVTVTVVAGEYEDTFDVPVWVSRVKRGIPMPGVGHA